MTNPWADAAVALRQTFRDRGARATLDHLARMALYCVQHARNPAARVYGFPRRAEADVSLRLPFTQPAPPATPPLRVAAICHAFYPALMPELRDHIANIPGDVDLFLSTDTAEKSAEIAGHLAAWRKGRVDIRLTQNRGRDLAPKLTAFHDVHAAYDLVLHLHAKRGAASTDGEAWRRYLLHNLIGTPAIAADVLAIFAHDRSVGMIGPQHWPPLRAYTDWQWNFSHALPVAGRMGVTLTPAHSVDYPSGSMFWCRPAALRPLLDLGLTAEDFPPEDGQIDGTIAHAIERLLFVACELAGFRWLKLCDPPAEPGWPPTVTLNSVHDLAGFHRRYGFRLTSARVSLTQ